MYLLELCDNGDVLSVLRIVNIILTIIRIAVPIILIVSLMIGYLKAVKDNDADALAKANKQFFIKTISAVLVFLIPTFVNVIIDIVDPGNNSYLSCLEDATEENIDVAYRIRTEKYIDITRESLKESDYKIAEASFLKVKDEATQQELRKELDDLRIYIDIRERIVKLSNEFDKNEYQKIKEEIDALEDEELKENLSDFLKESIGRSGSLTEFVLDPNDELYRNLKYLDGKTLESVLEENGSSVERLETQIKEAVYAAGVGTREAPAAAVLTLIQELANYGYKINYDWGGKWYKIGIDGEMGKKITPAYCSTHPDPDRCRTKLIWKGFDCSGLVTWAIIQGDDKVNWDKAFVKNDTSLARKTEAICDVGDIIVNPKHYTLVVGHNDEMKKYIVAEAGGNGTKISYYDYNNSNYYCRKVKYIN